MSTCDITGKEIFHTKALAMEVVLRKNQRKKNAKKFTGLKNRGRIHENPEIAYKCPLCGYWHISGVKQIEKTKHWSKTNTKKRK